MTKLVFTKTLSTWYDTTSSGTELSLKHESSISKNKEKTNYEFQGERETTQESHGSNTKLAKECSMSLSL